MKFLADMGVSISTVRALRQEGHDTVHLTDEGLQRIPDPEILEKARQEGRTVLTFNLDFGDLLASGLTESPSVIVFRLHDKTPSSVTLKLIDLIHQRAEDILKGAVVVVEDARYRLRRLPIRHTEEDL
ncbi:MAG TPA: DUF5615 family PIN-like protein [bacterium]|nr:DUF5615 family PIN-like protein [bacterium]HQO33366.1 DUF5615 family PIN-like protein [bacterium]HQP98602.1 DUF5615 family PIN-like protein [bacterium]